MKVSLLALAALLAGSAAFANQNATSVYGYDKIAGTTATDCTFVAQALNNDGTIAVGINSDTAEYVNTLVRIPQGALPLAEGYTVTDSRGMEAAYANGTLTVTRARSGLGDTENTKMVISVDAKLSRASAATVSKSDGLFSLTTEAAIRCLF